MKPSVACHASPRRDGLAGFSGLEDRIDVSGELVADEDFLGEAADQQHQPAREALGGVGAQIGPLVELVHDLAPAHQRPGENLREKPDIERVADEIVARRFARPSDPSGT